MFPLPTHPRSRRLVDWSNPFCIPSHCPSKAADQRFSQALAAFEQTKAEWQAKTDLEPGSKHIIALLQPECHVVAREVKSHPGWVAKRVAASTEAKAAAGLTFKGAAYFVNLVYSLPKAPKRAADSGGAGGAKTNKKRKTLLEETTNDAKPTTAGSI